MRPHRRYGTGRRGRRTRRLTERLPSRFRSGDALLVVDVQNDFCRGGALPRAGAEDAIPVLNLWIAAALQAGIPVFASRDWHPAGHVSFCTAAGEWPAHCLQDSWGADFHPELNLPGEVVIVSKGTRFDRDERSPFDRTGLTARLRSDGISRLWIGGLAHGKGVEATIAAALSDGFAAVVIEDAIGAFLPAGKVQASAVSAGRRLPVENPQTRWPAEQETATGQR